MPNEILSPEEIQHYVKVGLVDYGDVTVTEEHWEIYRPQVFLILVLFQNSILSAGTPHVNAI